MGQRRYRIQSVIGQGGFGRVYSAVLEADGGFRKRVALKVLGPKTDLTLPNLMERFRDEARILGLVQDRAFVGVEPPVQLQGRWTVVMELAEGESGRALLKRGALPVSCAIEVVQELARALGTAWSRPGPDGQPLRLLHRDLKPGNIQISSTGEVKLLDFGIAKASFDEREAKTTNDWAGTAGYSAPERLHGQDGPEGDVFSLGVVLHVLMTRDTPLGVGQYKEKDPRTPEMGPALALAAEMTQLDAGRRPTMREVEQRCRALLRTTAGPTLREWAEGHVQEGRDHKRDSYCGEVWTEGEEAVLALPEGAMRALHDGEEISDVQSSHTSNVRSGSRSASGVSRSGTGPREANPPTQSRTLPYTMTRTLDAVPLRERLKEETILPKYIDSTEVQREADKKLAAEREAERLAMEADRQRYEAEMNRPPPPLPQRVLAFLATPVGIVAGLAALCLGSAMLLVLTGAFQVWSAKWGADAARAVWLGAVDENARELRQSFTALGVPSEEVERHLGAWEAAKDEPSRLRVAAELTEWAGAQVAGLKPSVVEAHRLDVSVAAAAAKELTEDRDRHVEAAAAWRERADGGLGGIAATLHLAPAP